jgi:hypothetical protein
MEQYKNLNENVYKDPIKKWDISWLGVLRYILIPLVAALLSALLASHYTLYNVKYSIEESGKTSRRQSLHNDISILRVVDTELERNMVFLLQNQVYTPLVQFKEINIEKDVERFIAEQFKSSNQKTNYDRNFMRDAIIAFIKGSDASPVVAMEIGQTQIPDQYFYVGAWFSIRRTASEIDFEIVKLIDEFYIKIDKINNDISYVDKIVSYYSAVHFNNVNRIKLAIKSIENNLAAISRSGEIQNVKNKIRNEMERLRKQLEKIS